MTDSRLGNLDVIAHHGFDIHIDVNKVCTSIISAHPRRLTYHFHPFVNIKSFLIIKIKLKRRARGVASHPIHPPVSVPDI